MSSIPGFLSKTYEIFSASEFSDICGWGPAGDTIVIRKIEQFSKEILPKFFKHSNFQSFVRQLNMYDFHKTVQDPNHGEFKHQYFKQNRPDLLINIKRKANKPLDSINKKNDSSEDNPMAIVVASDKGMLGGGNKNLQANMMNHMGINVGATTNGRRKGGSNSSLQTSSNGMPAGHANVQNRSGSNQYIGQNGMPAMNNSATGVRAGIPMYIAKETDALIRELQQQQAQRVEFEQRVEAKLAHVEGENEMLKRLFMESHAKNTLMQDRLEKVLRTIYNLVMGSTSGTPVMNAPGGVLNTRSVSNLLQDLQFLQRQRQIDNQEGRNAEILSLLPASSDSKVEPVADISTLPGPPLGAFDQTGLDGQSLMRLDSLGSNLERLPSLDLGELSDFPDMEGSLPGAPISSAFRGSSFDMAAAQVAAPQVHLSNDQISSSSYYRSSSSNGQPITRNTAIGNDFSTASDSNLHDSNRNNYSSNNKRKANANSEAKKTRRTDDNKVSSPIQDASSNAIKEEEGVSHTTSSVLPTTASACGEADQNPEHYLNLLKRNQETSLTRLDSLEESIAMFLEDSNPDHHASKSPQN